MTIEADATQLRQVVLNLLANAREALCGEGGEIRVQRFTRLSREQTGLLVLGRGLRGSLEWPVRDRATRG